MEEDIAFCTIRNLSVSSWVPGTEVLKVCVLQTDM